jgi:metal-sulfur cluster biosynthetic enzyme
MSTELENAVRAALAKVIDPELRRPITELNMVKGVAVEPDGTTHVGIYLTTSACPKKAEISDLVRAAVADVPGTGTVTVDLDVMSDEQRTALRKRLRGEQGLSGEPVIPFAQPGSLTRVYAVASGTGGVGKSRVTVNLAAALAARGLSVGSTWRKLKPSRAITLRARWDAPCRRCSTRAGTSSKYSHHSVAARTTPSAAASNSPPPRSRSPRRPAPPPRPKSPN